MAADGDGSGESESSSRFLRMLIRCVTQSCPFRVVGPIVALLFFTISVISPSSSSSSESEPLSLMRSEPRISSNLCVNQAAVSETSAFDRLIGFRFRKLSMNARSSSSSRSSELSLNTSLPASSPSAFFESEKSGIWYGSDVTRLCIVGIRTGLRSVMEPAGLRMVIDPAGLCCSRKIRREGELGIDPSNRCFSSLPPPSSAGGSETPRLRSCSLPSVGDSPGPAVPSIFDGVCMKSGASFRLDDVSDRRLGGLSEPAGAAGVELSCAGSLSSSPALLSSKVFGFEGAPCAGLFCEGCRTTAALLSSGFGRSTDGGAEAPKLLGELGFPVGNSPESIWICDNRTVPQSDVSPRGTGGAPLPESTEEEVDDCANSLGLPPVPCTALDARGDSLSASSPPTSPSGTGNGLVCDRGRVGSAMAADSSIGWKSSPMLISESRTENGTTSQRPRKRKRKKRTRRCVSRCFSASSVLLYPCFALAFTADSMVEVERKSVRPREESRAAQLT
mmetsp:Transcript_4161/g.16179  ORF Transcript_4161/g.16179 Transcript_4161/m.16179 type:complete len:505 (-) Transcript_4161:20-1534(-)